MKNPEDKRDEQGLTQNGNDINQPIKIGQHQQ